MLRDPLRYGVSKYLEFGDCLNFGMSSKYYYDILSPQIAIKRENKIREIQDNFPERIINMIGKNRFLNMEKVEWNSKWLGPTEYIDRPPTLTDRAMVYGKDQYRRSFVFVQYEKYTLSIFQRYTDGDGFVVVCPKGGDETIRSILGGQVYINDVLLSKIQEFLKTYF